jgi:RimJ/RimL family protein N-acetyltransferase
MGLGGIVKGKRTTLRTPTEADLPALNRWMADLRVRHLTRPWHEPAMPATWKERLAEQTKDKSSALWSIDADGRLVGMVRVGFGWEPHRDSAHIDQFIIGPDEWRKGYGADAALALHRYLFDYLDLRRVSVNFTTENGGARRIAETLGYVEFAHKHEVHYRDGAYVDELELLMEHDTWNERWSSEREYAPSGPGHRLGRPKGDV